MTSKADPKFIERLRAIEAATRARSEAITEHGRRASEKLAARTQEHLQAMRKHAAEVNKRRAEHLQQQEQEDPTAKNQWLQRREATDTTFDFGDSEEGEQYTASQPPVAAAPAVPTLPPAVEMPQHEQPSSTPPPRREKRQPTHFDDDDFSNNSWMQ